MGNLSTSERVLLIKKQLGNVTNVKIATWSGASKSVVGQWISGEIQEIHPRYAYPLEEKTFFNAKWIMLGVGPELRDTPAAAQETPQSVTKNEETLAVIEIMDKLSPRSKIVMRTKVEGWYKDELLPDQEKRKAEKATIPNFIGRTGT